MFSKPVTQDKSKNEQKIDTPVLPYFAADLGDLESEAIYPYGNFDF